METKPPRWQTLLAFAIIYLVWGSTFLAIRIGVQEVPPLLLAAMRFLVAGVLLLTWTLSQREGWPSKREWISILWLGLLIFVVDYGLVFWAEQRVPSGLAAVMLALIPMFMAVTEIIFLGTQRMTMRLAAALLIGICGVGVLVSRSLDLGGTPINRVDAIALAIASLSVAVSTMLMRKLPLPSSKVLSSGAQMLVGGVMLAITSAGFGEFREFHPEAVSRAAWISLAYLIVAGSIVAFTAYVWLVQHESPTKVGTYAYVNPVVAVLLGYFFGGEALGARTVVGTVCVLASVVLITTTPAKKPPPVISLEEAS
jgi:drug/metabolite transporter (DMT)-like permease